MNRDRVLIEVAKLAPEWPTHSIVAVIDHPKTHARLGLDDPRWRSADLAEQIVRMWGVVARKAAA